MNDLKRISRSIRVKDSVYHLAHVSAVSSRKSLGLWLEEAILEKVNSENGNIGVRDVRQPARLAD